MHRRNRFVHAIAGALGIAAAGAAPAVPVSVVNPGFEDITGETPASEFTFGPLNGWDLYDPGGVTDGGDGPTFFIGTLAPTPPEFFNAGEFQGQRVGIAFNEAGSDGDEYGFVQTLGDSLQANTRYTLQVDVGNIASGTAQTFGFFNLDGFPGYRVDLLAGGVVIAQDVNSLAGAIAEGTFETATVSFTTGAAPAQLGQALGIRLVNLNVLDPSAPGADLEVDFDDVRLDATRVPEPAALALLLAGLLAAVARAVPAGRRRTRFGMGARLP